MHFLAQGPGPAGIRAEFEQDQTGRIHKKGIHEVNYDGPNSGPFFVLKFVQLRLWGEMSSNVLQQSLVTVKYHSRAQKWPLIAVNGIVNGR